VIPATKDYTVYISNNNLQDSFIVVPADLDSWSIVGVAASYGSQFVDPAIDWTIELRDTDFSVVDNIDYTHPSSTRQYIFSPNPTIQVFQGYTLNVNLQTGATQPTSAQGYTVTLTLELLPV
jgi:hypothetical protein